MKKLIIDLQHINSKQCHFKIKIKKTVRNKDTLCDYKKRILEHNITNSHSYMI